MAFHLIHADRHSLLASDGPLLKAADRSAIEDAAALLRTVRSWHDSQHDALATARSHAAAQGRQAGEAEGRADFAAAIAALTEQAHDDAARREEDVAALALAALRQIVGALPDADMMSGVARRAVEALGSRGPVLIEVSTTMLPHVEAAFADRPSAMEVAVRAQDGLTDDQCRITAPDGRIVADVGVQIQSFATRWEVADAI